MLSLPSSKSYLKDINQLLYNFLWDKKGDKIKRREMLNDYEYGGLRMLDIQTFNHALKAKWVQKYLDDNNRGKWKLFFDYFLAQHNGKLLMTGNIKPTDVASLNIQDSFTNEIVEIWSQINYDESPRYFANIPIWYNSLIRVANKPVFYQNWSNAGINQVKDILDKNPTFLNLTTLKLYIKSRPPFSFITGLFPR